MFSSVLLGFFSKGLAANVAVLSNQYEDVVAADFNTNIPGHTFTGIDVSAVTPTLATLTAYDAVLLFEDGLFANSTSVGNRVAEYANTGRPVVLGTFYNQDRSDNTSFSPNGWGTLETIDPNTTDGVGTSYDGDTLDAGSIVPHALTTGVTTLWSDGYSGGNEAKAGTTVLALWSNLNAQGNPDPAIAYRITGSACVIHIGIAPQYSQYGTLGNEFGGDFYQAWTNAFDFAAAGCSAAAPAPGTGVGRVFTDPYRDSTPYSPGSPAP